MIRPAAKIDGTPSNLAIAGHIPRGFDTLSLDMNLREGRAAVMAPKMDPKESCIQSELCKKKVQAESTGVLPALILHTLSPAPVIMNL